MRLQESREGSDKRPQAGMGTPNLSEGDCTESPLDNTSCTSNRQNTIEILSPAASGAAAPTSHSQQPYYS